MKAVPKLAGVLQTQNPAGLQAGVLQGRIDRMTFSVEEKFKV